MTTKEPTNAERAERAARILLVYQAKYDKGEDWETALTDLLTDIRHFCDEEAVDFCLGVARSQDHYKAEKAEERKARNA